MSIQSIQWVEIDEHILRLLTQSCELVPLTPGLEADVVRVDSHEQSFVLKTWNKQSKPNVGRQYRLLAELSEQGLAVSKPYGWGVDDNNSQVLLMSYDGKPVSKLSKKKVQDLAQKLIDVHNVNNLDSELTPKYHFVDYFFPGLESHQDIHDSLKNAMTMIELSQTHLIHGDYNLGNVLEKQDQCTIIDWTNGQLGDPRYDIAWSVFLMKVYAGARYGEMYGSYFLKLTDYSSEELKVFEAIACLRWILLSRTSELAKDAARLKQVKDIMDNNERLSGKFLLV